VVERQRTLRAAVDWSFRLLAPELQDFFARLSVFRGGWTAEAAEAVTGEPLALDYLAQLRECSLVQTEDTGTARCASGCWNRCASTPRAGSRPRSAPAPRAPRRPLPRPCRAGRAETDRPGPGRLARRLHADHDNLRAALANTTDEESLLRWAGALWRFWSVRGTRARGGACSPTSGPRARHPPDAGPRRLRAGALDGAGALAHDQGEYAVAATLHDASAVLWREVGDERGLAAALNHRGNAALDQDDYEQAVRCYEEALELYRKLGDRSGGAGFHQPGRARLRPGRL
jgi:tetratricopeptide (TPR) repeat protein